MPILHIVLTQETAFGMTVNAELAHQLWYLNQGSVFTLDVASSQHWLDAGATLL